MITEADYWALNAELEAIEKATGAYIADVNVDHENVDETWKSGGTVSPTDPEFWSHMYGSACMAAGIRAEDAGLNINELIGRQIY
tara:strand:+ start:398 stop:652 length:255 start_codon:yes stop_codon:yes gene_type:complete